VGLHHGGRHADVHGLEPRAPERRDDGRAAGRFGRRLAASADRLQRPDQRRAVEHQLRADAVGPEPAHQLRGQGARHPEQLFEILAREGVAVECLELRDGVRNAREPQGRKRHGQEPASPANIGNWDDSMYIPLCLCV
jgi:hypothetical protein